MLGAVVLMALGSVTVTPVSGLVTSEGGGTAQFDVALDIAPSADVMIGLSSSDPNEGIVTSGATLTFTSADWDTAQTVTITGVDDDIDDGDVGYTILTGVCVSADTTYSVINPSDVSVTNLDDDVIGITVSRLSGLVTSEDGGQDTFAVVLDTEPGANVTIDLSSSDETEGTINGATLGVLTLTFTSGNWSTPHIVTITGADDITVDGSIAYSIVTANAASPDPNYDAFGVDDVNCVNVDNDVPAVVVNPTSGLVTTEAGGAEQFTVVLSSPPTASVTIDLTSSDLSEGTVTPSLIVFTVGNWSTPQTVTVTGLDDSVVDRDVIYTVITANAASGDADYNGFVVADVSVTNLDDDVADVTVTPTTGLVTTEAGDTAQFTVVLDAQPGGDVWMELRCYDESEGTIDGAVAGILTLIFTPLNWDVAQAVTITGQDDDVSDGTIAYNIDTGPLICIDGEFNGLDGPDVSLENLDDDVVGITITPTSGLVTTEAGGTAQFTVVLDSQPTADVTIGLSSSDETEGTIVGAVSNLLTLTFTPANWSVAQTVTITGQDDVLLGDGDVAYTIQTAQVEGPDGNYNGMDPIDVSVTNIDDDIYSVVVNPTTGLITTETGGTAGFTAVLYSAPGANVTVDVSSSDESEGTINGAVANVLTLTFTPANWDTPRTVTLTGMNDDVDDGDIAYTIVTAAAASADVNFEGVVVNDVSVTNTDDDAVGVTVDPVSGLVTSESGGQDTFTVVLDSEPTADVTIDLSSSDESEGVIEGAASNVLTLTFTSADWDTPQTATLTGLDDALDDGSVAYTITTAAAASSDPAYGGMAVADVDVINTDDDTVDIVVNPTTGLMTVEDGTSAQFIVVLSTQPTADVTLDLSSSDGTEGTIVGATANSLTLTFTASDWSTPQTVTVAGVDDDVDDDDATYTIVTAVAVSGDAGYDALNPDDVSMTNQDDDTAGITLDPASGLVTTEAGGTAQFTVVLDSEPLAGVTFSLSSSDESELTVNGAVANLLPLTFTSANWDVPQSVTLTGVDDAVADGNVAYTIVTNPAASADADYSGLEVPDASGTNQDDDAASVTVSPTSGLITTEGGGSDTFTIVLGSEPDGDATVDISAL